MNKKIGILTFHKSLNYGSALQAYALVQQLALMGYEVEIIDYRQKNYDKLYSLLRIPFSKEAIKYDLNHLYHLATLARREKEFGVFAEKNLCLSEIKFQYGDDLRCLGNKYDILLCGSDQIWNPNAKDFDTNYFFPNIDNTPKISYAVSLNKGELENKENKDEIKGYLKDFKALSVREYAGKDRLESFMKNDKTVSVVPDPTLLHQKEFYDTISAPRQINGRYIFLYSISSPAYVIQAARELSKRTGLPVYTLYNGRSGLKLLKNKDCVKVWKGNVGPEGFISLVRYADCIITNSFHGTVFSIIYEKKFWAIGASDKNNTIIRDERICNILDLLNLSERFITAKQTETVLLDLPIDYTEVNRIKKSLAEEAVVYLQCSIDQEKNI